LVFIIEIIFEQGILTVTEKVIHNACLKLWIKLRAEQENNHLKKLGSGNEKI